jgi:hypothetical protein
MSLSSSSSSPTCNWRPGDAEALAALIREMALLEQHYPTGVCSVQGHVDAFAALDRQLAALTPAELNAPIGSRRKGVAGGVVPNPLPLSKSAVVEDATDLLLEETENEWDPTGPSAAVVLELSAAPTSARWRCCCRGCRTGGSAQWIDPGPRLSVAIGSRNAALQNTSASKGMPGALLQAELAGERSHGRA